jgi:hypothetical protein
VLKVTGLFGLLLSTTLQPLQVPSQYSLLQNPSAKPFFGHVCVFPTEFPEEGFPASTISDNFSSFASFRAEPDDQKA